MSKVSFEGIGEVTVTFACEPDTTAGQVVKLTGPGRVGPCDPEDRPAGVALSVKDGFAAVQLRGFTSVHVSGGTLTEGWACLSADGEGGLKTAGSDASGNEYLVVEAGSDTATILL